MCSRIILAAGLMMGHHSRCAYISPLHWGLTYAVLSSSTNGVQWVLRFCQWADCRHTPCIPVKHSRQKSVTR
jgi:hypothetical protein